jgi:SAM-dependent methyltransferase
MSDNRWATEWETLAGDDPYWAVLNVDPNRGATLSDEAAARFWTSGEESIAATFDTIATCVGHPFTPRRAVDFGCGVGRLTIPIARRSAAVVGVDLSPTMLEHTRREAERLGLDNVSVVRSDDTLSQLTGSFDFIHSFIVFQHIPPDLGYTLAARLIERLDPGGVGMLHFTFERRASPVRKAVHAARRRWSFANAVVNVVQGQPARKPMLPMFEYDRRRIQALLDRAGCTGLQEAPTDHGGHLGAVLYFRKGR